MFRVKYLAPPFQFLPLRPHENKRLYETGHAEHRERSDKALLKSKPGSKVARDQQAAWRSKS